MKLDLEDYAIIFLLFSGAFFVISMTILALHLYW
jgi:hypothetical protein